jgi:hypothetical protein
MTEQKKHHRDKREFTRLVEYFQKLEAEEAARVTEDSRRKHFSKHIN